MDKKWSKYQLAIFDFFKNSTDSVVINASAGSGKTTTMAECAKMASRQGDKSLFCCFNKSIATELQSKMYGVRNVFCKTLHSHGWSAIMKTFADQRPSVDNRKWSKYIDSNFSALSNMTFDNNQQMYSYKRTLADLLDLCRINLIKNGNTDAILDLALHHGLDIIGDEVAVVNELLNLCYEIPKRDMVFDYTDMIVLPNVVKSIKRNLDNYNVVFVDECQDLNKAQQSLVINSIERGGRFFAVGDRNQAINGFCGADAKSFDTLVDIAKHELPLSKCYRCGKDIVKLAQTIVPSIEYNETAIDGIIEHVADLSNVRMGDMIICRKSAPLVGLCLKMISNGISAKVKGTDLAESLKKLIDKMKAKDIYELYEKLDNEKSKMIAHVEKLGFKTPNNAPSVMAFQDKIDCIRVVADTCLSIDDIKAKLDTIFTDYRNGRFICLSTIHKAKGLESDRVHIIVPNKLPLIYRGQQEWEYEQEMNLKYVAITRAKKELYFVDMDEDALHQYTFNDTEIKEITQYA